MAPKGNARQLTLNWKRLCKGVKKHQGNDSRFDRLPSLPQDHLESPLKKMLETSRRDFIERVPVSLRRSVAWRRVYSNSEGAKLCRRLLSLGFSGPARRPKRLWMRSSSADMRVTTSAS